MIYFVDRYVMSEYNLAGFFNNLVKEGIYDGFNVNIVNNKIIIEKGVIVVRDEFDNYKKIHLMNNVEIDIDNKNYLFLKLNSDNTYEFVMTDNLNVSYYYIGYISNGNFVYMCERHVYNPKNYNIGSGYIYFQLSGMSSPNNIFSGTTWYDVTNDYNRCYMRVVGDLTGNFGDTNYIQNDNLLLLPYYLNKFGERVYLFSSFNNLLTGTNNYVEVDVTEKVKVLSSVSSNVKEYELYNYSYNNNVFRLRDIVVRVWRKI